MKLRAGDFFVIVVIAVLAISVWIFLPIRETPGESVSIERDGKLIYEVSLLREKIIELDECTIQIKNGEAGIIDSSCPDKTCIKSGTISKDGETIICVPNRIIVKTGGKGVADVIAG